MGKKRSKGRDETMGLDPALDGAGSSAAPVELADPGAAKLAKALRKRITSLDEDVTVARRRIERRRERLIEAERELRTLERELAAALREARSEGVEDPGSAAAGPPPRRTPRTTAATTSPSEPPSATARATHPARPSPARKPPAAPTPPAPAGVTPRTTRRRTPAAGSRPAGGSRRRPRDPGAEPDTEAGPPS